MHAISERDQLVAELRRLVAGRQRGCGEAKALLDRAMAHRISTHRLAAEVELLKRSIAVAKPGTARWT